MPSPGISFHASSTSFLSRIRPRVAKTTVRSSVLLREISAYEDGDFTEEKLKNLYQGDLANGLGNFLARVLTMALKMEINARLKTESSVAEKIKETSKIIEEKMSDLKFNEALAAIWELISFGDNYINKNEPWKISDSKQKEKIIFNLIAILEGAAEFLAPFLPKTSKKILANIEKSENIIKVYRGENLFPRI